jgi:hypothetical protein
MSRPPGPSVRAFIPPLILLVATGAYLAVAYNYEPNARLMPVAVAWILVVLLVLDLVMATGSPAGRLTARLLNPSLAAEEKLDPLRQLSALFWPCLFTLLLFGIGVLAAVPIYVFASMRFHGGWSLRWSGLTAIAASGLTWFLFELLLQINLYPGALFAEY